MNDSNNMELNPVSNQRSNMDQEEKVLKNECVNLKDEVNRIVSRYSSSISGCPAINAQLKKIVNRSKEYEGGTYIVLVVGPVKSGKSTLVNLIAHAYVSPTHFLECTVRPSIISKRSGEDNKITVYTSEDTKDRIEQIDTIVDCIRGIAGEDSLVNIKKSEFDLTRENIEDKVKLGLKESLSSETLVTSITTPGGKLMDENVFIVDMPGFDGEYANIDDPVYDTIAQRADLIVFVQSSNSAISKVSKQFLQKLADNNQEVPVCLIHNVFDSAYWRSIEERDKATDEQKGFAISEIERRGFNIDDKQCFKINLGKVEDSCNPAYSDNDDLKSEREEYDGIETKLYERVINRRDAMRLKVCLDRTHRQIVKTIETIDKELAQRSKLSDQYKRVVDDFNNIKIELNNPLEQLSSEKCSTTLKEIIKDEAERRVNQIDRENNHNTNTAAKIRVLDFIEACENRISDSFYRSLEIDKKEEKLLEVCNSKIDVIKYAVEKYNTVPRHISLEQRHITDIPSISLSDGIDLNLIVPRKNTVDIYVKQYGGHSAEKIVKYINKAADTLAGAESDESNKKETYVDDVLRPVLDRVNLRVNEVLKEYEKICEEYRETSRDAVLEGIIKNKEAFDIETDQIKNLKEDLSKVRNLI